MSLSLKRQRPKQTDCTGIFIDLPDERSVLNLRVNAEWLRADVCPSLNLPRDMPHIEKR
jgi:hypothetical protein